MPKTGVVAAAVPVVAGLLLVLVTPRAGRAADGAEPLQDPGFPSVGARVRVTSSALPPSRAVGTLRGLEKRGLAFQARNAAV